MDRKEKEELINSVPFWFHSIDFDDGLVSPGLKPLELLEHEVRIMDIPDLEGKEVLDIGAWDGCFSFEAERRGAKRVLALDHYAWSLDLEKQQKYWEDCELKKIKPEPYHLVPELWDPIGLPGKKGFDVANKLLESKVESKVADFMEVPLDEIGKFDVVFFLGVLYHLEDPLSALRRLYEITRECLIIETAAIVVPDQEDRALFEFYESNELGHDVSNWWAPNLLGLKKICRAAGFHDVEATFIPELDKDSKFSQIRLTVKAKK